MVPHGSAKNGPLSIGGLPSQVSAIQLITTFRIEVGPKQLYMAESV